MDRFARLEEIDLDRLKADGVRALLLDADNTLGLWQDPAPSQGALRLVRAAKQAGFSLIIVSNAGAERLLGGWHAEGETHIPAPVEGTTPRVLTRKKDIEQVHICLAFPGVEQDDEDLYPISVMNNLFGGGMSSRLFQRIREEMGAAYSVYSFPSTYTNCGTFTVYAGTSPETAQQVADELHNQIRLLRDGGVTQEEFDMAKEQLKVSYVLGLESSSARMSAIGRSKLLRGHAVDPQDVIRKIEAVTKEDVERVAHRMFGRPFSASAVGRNIDGLKLL